MLRRLNSALSPTRIELIDDSEQHRGHGGYNPAGESHFTLAHRKPGLRRQEPCRAAADDLCGARRPDARAESTPCRFARPLRERMMATIETRHSIRRSRRSRTTSATSRSTARLPARERTMVGPFIFVDEFGPARLPGRTGDGRAAASAHQPRDRHLSVRGRDRASRQHRHRMR